MRYAKRLSQQNTGSNENYYLALSGSTVRRRKDTAHIYIYIYIYIIQYRWQKALLNTILAEKNIYLSLSD
ncbi:hypothetical protein ACEYX6_08605 [Acinetobacter sp. c2-A9]|uniref:hypothetical protein n=1 Tax=Acinetobacter sp. c2-A9 TaxID=3342802 RepID=UPI0035BA38FA